MNVIIIVFKHLLDDHSRVVLELEDNCLGSDYINASFIDVSDNPEICSHVVYIHNLFI